MDDQLDASEASMSDRRLEPMELAVGGSSRTRLLEALRSSGVLLNAHAETLIAHPVFNESKRESLRVVERTVAQLGLIEGGTLPEVYAAATEHGLGLCPTVTGPYLRLAWATQAGSANSVMSAGTSPDGALNIASPVLDGDVDLPKGFYLRVVDGRQWLRGYRCDDLYRFSPDVRFAFRQIA